MNNIGDIIVLKEFSFIDKEGKTIWSNWRHNEIYSEEAKFTITEIGDEAGKGSSGKCLPDSSNSKLMDYLERLCKVEENSSRDQPYLCYWHESDIIENY